MDKLTIDALAGRLEVLEREKQRWKCLAGVTALGVALLLAIGGLLGSRVVVAQQLEKVGNPVPRRMEYKVSETVYLNQMDKPLREMAAEGWELVQVVPTVWTTGGQGQSGDFHKGIIVARRPLVPGK